MLPECRGGHGAAATEGYADGDNGKSDKTFRGCIQTVVRCACACRTRRRTGSR